MQDEVLVQNRWELDMVLVNVEAGVKVKQRADFFSWVQGVFQGMLAHEGLMCGLPHPKARGLRFEWMGSFPVSQNFLFDMVRRDGGLMPSLVAHWQRGGRKPFLLSDGLAAHHANGAIEENLVDALGRLELTNVAAHGLPGLDGQPAAFFAFFKLPADPNSRAARMLELLVPHLLAAWLRVNCEEGEQGLAPPNPGREILTVREVEILNWVEKGKSNNEIAQILTISHLTVKNHVQKILRKLNVQNRAQAVAKGISLQLTSTWLAHSAELGSDERRSV